MKGLRCMIDTKPWEPKRTKCTKLGWASSAMNHIVDVNIRTIVKFLFEKVLMIGGSGVEWHLVMKDPKDQECRVGWASKWYREYQREVAS